MPGATRQRLDASRWHFQHGPIDLVIEAHGPESTVAAAHGRAWLRFQNVLTELVAELPTLRAALPAHGSAPPVQGAVARRMLAACWPHRAEFITPMAAVAGAVADELMACYRAAGMERAWINNGGDIALHLAPGQCVRVGVVAQVNPMTDHVLHTRTDLPAGLLDGRFELTHHHPVRGVATSGWRGRSFSLGIADSVTVLAADAATADAAATMVANAVNVDDLAVRRARACDLKDDSDLGERLVTVDVAPLPAEAVRQALAAGRACVQRLQRAGLVWAAVGTCQGQSFIADPLVRAVH